VANVLFVRRTSCPSRALRTRRLGSSHAQQPTSLGGRRSRQSVCTTKHTKSTKVSENESMDVIFQSSCSSCSSWLLELSSAVNARSGECDCQLEASQSPGGRRTRCPSYMGSTDVGLSRTAGRGVLFCTTDILSVAAGGWLALSGQKIPTRQYDDMPNWPPGSEYDMLATDKMSVVQTGRRHRRHRHDRVAYDRVAHDRVALDRVALDRWPDYFRRGGGVAGVSCGSPSRSHWVLKRTRNNVSYGFASPPS